MAFYGDYTCNIGIYDSSSIIWMVFWNLLAFGEFTGSSLKRFAPHIWKTGFGWSYYFEAYGLAFGADAFFAEQLWSTTSIWPKYAFTFCFLGESNIGFIGLKDELKSRLCSKLVESLVSTSSSVSRPILSFWSNLSFLESSLSYSSLIYVNLLSLITSLTAGSILLFLSIYCLLRSINC